MLNNVRQCEQQTKRNTKCKAPAVSSQPWCLAHAPLGTPEHEKMDQARRRGGQVTKADARVLLAVVDELQKPSDVRRMASQLIAAIKAGEVPAGVAGAMYSLGQLAIMAMRLELEEQRRGLGEDDMVINVIHQDFPDEPEPVDTKRAEILRRLNDGNPSADDVIRSRRDTNGGFARD